MKTVCGAKVRVCDSRCAAAFRSDRMNQLMYPSTWGKHKVKMAARWYSPEEASIRFHYCVYCHQGEDY